MEGNNLETAHPSCPGLGESGRWPEGHGWGVDGHGKVGRLHCEQGLWTPCRGRNLEQYWTEGRGFDFKRVPPDTLALNLPECFRHVIPRTYFSWRIIFQQKKKKKILKWSLILIIRGSKWHSCRGTFSVSGADSWQQAKQWNAGILNVLNTWILTRRWGSVVELSLGALCPHVNPSVNVNFGFCFYSINKNCLFS